MEKSEQIIEGYQLEAQPDFEHSLIDALDLSKWTSGPNLAEIYANWERIKESVQDEEMLYRRVREEIVSKIRSNPNLPEYGIQHFSIEDIRKAHHGLLFNGGVEAADGTILSHDTLPLTITQIGVCLVSYQGEQGSYSHRLFRKDLAIRENDPLDAVWKVLQARKEQSAQGVEDTGFSKMSALAQRGLMAYAERGVLFESSSPAKWRMGHGSPFPWEMFTGAWATSLPMTEAAVNLFEKMIQHKKFVFVPSAGNRAYITLGNALSPGEYIVLNTLKEKLGQLVENGGARGKQEKRQLDFVSEFGDKVIHGLYRASQSAPPFEFYAHRDHVRIAALIAMADSLLQELRGFPMLIDVADSLCNATFKPETFYSTIHQAYAQAGYPFRFLGERETRQR